MVFQAARETDLECKQGETSSSPLKKIHHR
jgi:hypothetical protein